MKRASVIEIATFAGLMVLLIGLSIWSDAASRPSLGLGKTATTGSSPKRCYAFIVAASDYANVTPLTYTVNDAKRFRDCLIKSGFPTENVTTLVSKADNFLDLPTKANIEKRFRAFVSLLQPGDLAIVYLSGHGIQLKNSNAAYFAPADVSLDDVEGTSVSIDSMMATLASSAASFRWMIVDACRNDPNHLSKSFGTRAPGVKDLENITNAPSSISLLQSCQPGKMSYEGGNGKAREIENGFFTLSLLEALDANNPVADVDRNGTITFSEMFHYVSRRTNEMATNYYGDTQTPNLSGNITDFALVQNLLIDGLTREKWEEADRYYQESVRLRRRLEFREAKKEISKAREINANNEQYADDEKELTKIVEYMDVADRTASETSGVSNDRTDRDASQEDSASPAP